MGAGHEIAEGISRGDSDLSELSKAYQASVMATDEAWSSVQSLKLSSDSDSESSWPISEATDAAWMKYCVAAAAKTCAETAEEEILFTTTPDSACGVRAWQQARLARAGGDQQYFRENQ